MTPGILLPSARPRTTIVVGIAGVVLVVAFGFILARTGGVTRLDLAVTSALNDLHSGVLGGIATAIYGIFSPLPAAAITVAVVAMVWIVSRRVRVAALFAAVVVVTWLPTAGLKILVQRPRPAIGALSHPFASQPVDGSYPSGHTAFMVALVVAFALLTRGAPARPAVIAGGALLVVIVVFALLVDGVHYPSDVLASVLWSLTLAPLVHLVARKVLA